MGINIYAAWRVLEPWLPRVLERYQKIAKPYVEDFVFSIIESEYKKNNKLSPYALLRESWNVIELASKNDADVQTKIAITYDGDYCVIRGFGELPPTNFSFNETFHPDKIQVPSYEEFFYFTGTDQPEEIPEAEWDKRGEYWRGFDKRYMNLPTTIMYLFEYDHIFFVRNFSNWGWPQEGANRFDHVPERFRTFFEMADRNYLKNK